MFSGIVEGLGTVSTIEQRGAGARLTVEADGLLADAIDGESIAVNGACLTVAERPVPGSVTFDLMPETLRRSNLGLLEVGSAVNLERSLRYGDRVGGHFVQGHLDGVAEVVAVDAEDEARMVGFRLHDPRFARYVVEKGFIALDGVSLTVVDTTPPGFTVSLVATTLERTTLGRARPGTIVNLEVDLFARYLVDRGDPAASQPMVDAGAPR
jgi:riboflavin synthase